MQKAINKGSLAMVNVRNNCDVSNLRDNSFSHFGRVRCFQFSFHYLGRHKSPLYSLRTYEIIGYWAFIKVTERNADCRAAGDKWEQRAKCLRIICSLDFRIRAVPLISGKVLRRHAGGYLVHSDQLNAVFQCPVRARLKKEGVSIFTGDLVELDEVETALSPDERGTAVITARLARKNLLTKPFIANLDQVFIVQSMHQPEWNPLLCDRYIVTLQLELDHFSCFICLNKTDLAEKGELEALRNIYEPLGYKIFSVSAKTGEGIAELKEALRSKTSVLIGPSGVGKSSIINQIIPDINLKVDINEDLLVGRHTTTHSQIFQLPLESSAPGPRDASGWIGDTPGFNMGELEYPQPADVAWQFPEIVELARDCKFSNCLHLGEAGCNVEQKLSAIAPTRYESYCVIVGDSQNEEKLRRDSSSKVDAGTKKQVGGHANARVLPRLNERFRANSRRKQKQGLNDFRKLDQKTLSEESDDGDEDILDNAEETGVEDGLDDE